jgi:TonB-dependent starch-binding outer membrane protein SusC
MRSRSPIRTVGAALLLATVAAPPVSGVQDSAHAPAATSLAWEGRIASPAAQELLRTPVEVEFEGIALWEALLSIQEASGVPIAYSPSHLPVERMVDCPCRNATLAEAMESILRGTSFEFIPLADQVVLRRRSLNDLESRLALLTGTEEPLGGARLVSTEIRRPILPTHLRSTPEAREGQITGTVLGGRALRPLQSVQISIPGTGLGTVTNAQGRFVLMNVPAVKLPSVPRCWATPLRNGMTVVSGGTVQVEFTLLERALDLDEIVVTGTAGQARRREIGNTLERVDFANLREPTLSVEEALQARAPGVNVLMTSGAIGAGSQIRLRGNVSVAMSSQPLIYVDGVRVFSEAYPSQHGRDFPGGRGAATSTSALNDINPRDIERIEVVKGPAATTLYGTEASAGVIQIFTRRGQQGRARWTAQIDQGFGWVQPFAPKGATYGPENRRSEYLFIDPWLNTGHWQRYSLSVGGGAQDLTYFLSASLDDNRGVLHNEAEDRYTMRGNLDFTPIPGLALQWNTSFTSHSMQRVSNGNNAHGLALNAYRLDANYFGDGAKHLIDQVLEYDNLEDVSRFVTGLTARHTFGNFSNRVTVGYDKADWEGRNIRRFGYIIFPRGALGVTRWTTETLSVDYVGSFGFPLPGDLRSTFSWGAQSSAEEETEVEGWSEDFPGPGEPTLTSGADTRSFESRMRVVNAGFFVQNAFDLRDRYFLTLGLRVDGNSAFGSDFGLQAYPRASFSYVVSDEDFWPSAWGSFRLRGAYGHAGRAPGAFDAVRTWNPTSWAGESAFIPRNLGNPELGPERTREVEVGFETSLLDDRLGVNFTYYNQRTEDALFPVLSVPSTGNWPSQLRNVGEIENRGIELGIDVAVYESLDFGWDLGVNFSTNESEVLDLGGAPPFTSQGGRIQVGQPVFAQWRSRRIMNPHEIAEPIISTAEEDQFWGPSWPIRILQLSSSFRFPHGIRLSGRGEYQGGHYVGIGPTNGAVSRGNRQWPICLEAYRLQDEGRLDEIKAWDRMRCNQATSSGDWNVSPADFVKLRDVSLSSPLPFFPATTDAEVTLSVQNIRLWKHRDMELFDPEMGGGNLGPRSGSRNILEQLPPPARFSIQLRVGF